MGATARPGDRRRGPGWAGLALSLAFAPGCSDASGLDLTEMLKVTMVGVFEAPPDVTGNAEPSSITFTLQGVTLTGASGSVLDIFKEAEAEPAAYRIISRPQIIFEAPLADYVGDSFESINLAFDPKVTGSSQLEPELTAALANAAPSYVKPLTIAKAKSLTLEISVQWKNTITRNLEVDPPSETLSAPTLSLDLKNQ